MRPAIAAFLIQLARVINPPRIMGITINMRG